MPERPSGSAGMYNLRKMADTQYMPKACPYIAQPIPSGHIIHAKGTSLHFAAKGMSLHFSALFHSALQPAGDGREREGRDVAGECGVLLQESGDGVGLKEMVVAV